MRDLIEIRLTSRTHFGLLRYTCKHLRQLLPLHRPEQLSEAIDQLLENVVEHAYEKLENMDVTVRFTITPRQLQIDVEDSGLPFDFTPFMSEAVDQTTQHEKGFYRIYDLVDRFWFTMLENRGKRFSVIQAFEHNYDIRTGKTSTALPDKETILQRLDVRRFDESDAEGIAQLIYKNYHYTYYKSQFYDPVKIRQLNQDREVVSIVAVYGVRVVGHFALVLSRHTEIAEIAIAAVDPEFKKMGIMNRMFDTIIATARAMHLNAIYGEALMLHPYSQRANLSHGMCETAIVLGEVPSQTEIERQIKASLRSGAMISFLVFDTHKRYCLPPQRYAGQIEAAYRCAKVENSASRPANPNRQLLSHHLNPYINVGFIIIEGLPDDEALDELIDLMHTDHCEMVYADINLHHIEEIDEVVAMLNRRHFFYSGVFFSYYHNEDYLRLQRKNSRFVDEEQLVCYSQHARAMLEYIQADEARVAPAGAEVQ
ncbi:GNAT family N-acetyltransferase [Sulfurimonas sp. HSL1-6]|uniref:GNAT family N-acetyltransferase n=1 Tax=Thiomicrolovo immobilis TaxID=3131935 RepID=UPI0031F7A13D